MGSGTEVSVQHFQQDLGAADGVLSQISVVHIVATLWTNLAYIGIVTNALIVLMT